MWHLVSTPKTCLPFPTPFHWSPRVLRPLASHWVLRLKCLLPLVMVEIKAPGLAGGAGAVAAGLATPRPKHLREWPRICTATQRHGLLKAALGSWLRTQRSRQLRWQTLWLLHCAQRQLCSYWITTRISTATCQGPLLCSAANSRTHRMVPPE